jgi:translation initiation factor 1
MITSKFLGGLSMPFTIGGEWKPEEQPKVKPKHPVKVVKEKRGNATVTLLLNLSLKPDELKQLCSKLKQTLGCGGSVKEGKIELQGDKVEAAKEYLKTL